MRLPREHWSSQSPPRSGSAGDEAAGARGGGSSVKGWLIANRGSLERGRLRLARRDRGFGAWPLLPWYRCFPNPSTLPARVSGTNRPPGPPPAPRPCAGKLHRDAHALDPVELLENLLAQFFLACSTVRERTQGRVAGIEILVFPGDPPR